MGSSQKKFRIVGNKMNKKYPLTLFIFRRDLRLYDNTALTEALKSSAAVIPCFIFDKRQIENNNYHMTIITTICLLQSAILNVCKRFKKIDFILFISKHSLYICSSLSPFLPPPLRPFSDQL